MTSYFNNLNLIALFWKWRKQLLIATIAAGIAAIIFSSPFFIKPLFSSVVVIYPSNIKAYADESNTEQMLQFLESGDIKDSLIKRFDLYKHYDINPSGTKAYYYVSLYYDDAVSIRKTRYESVEIKVRDKDPLTACSMVKAIMDIYNLKVNKVQHEKFAEAYALSHQMVQYKIKEIDSLNILLKGFHTKNQLIDFDKQTTEMIRGYLRTIDGANRTSINTPEVLRLKKELEAKGTDFLIVDNQFRQAIEELGKLKESEDQAFRDYNRNFSYINIITAPYPAQKNSYPIRWLITLSTILVTLITSLVIVIVIENRKKISAAFTSFQE
jgi:capsule polysaccharide export protein KpsE/RkpR